MLAAANQPTNQPALPDCLSNQREPGAGRPFRHLKSSLLVALTPSALPSAAPPLLNPCPFDETPLLLQINPPLPGPTPLAPLLTGHGDRCCCVPGTRAPPVRAPASASCPADSVSLSLSVDLPCRWLSRHRSSARTAAPGAPGSRCVPRRRNLAPSAAFFPLPYEGIFCDSVGVGGGGGGAGLVDD